MLKPGNPLQNFALTPITENESPDAKTGENAEESKQEIDFEMDISALSKRRGTHHQAPRHKRDPS